MHAITHRAGGTAGAVCGHGRGSDDPGRDVLDPERNGAPQRRHTGGYLYAAEPLPEFDPACESLRAISRRAEDREERVREGIRANRERIRTIEEELQALDDLRQMTLEEMRRGK